jgi:LmbE family N-acetylglucosaminyl deacetylase
VTNKQRNDLAQKDLGRSAIVFSPHPDDETLGCGGTIIKKRKAGADVCVVFMTDGRRSHSHLVSVEELTAIRASEALKATRILGVEEDDVIFLEFEDHKLHENQNAAQDKVAEILWQKKPDEIFIPYYKETPSDHFSTNRIITSALRMYTRPTMVFEYPIWFWHHWPCTKLTVSSVRAVVQGARRSLVAWLALRKDFRSANHIGDVLEIKQTALDQYKSQMTRLVPDQRWRTLADVADGEFLKCFFQQQEIFHTYRLNPLGPLYK